MTLNANNTDINNISTSVQFISLASDAEIAIVDTFSEGKLKKLVTALFENDENTINNGLGKQEHFANKHKLFFSLAGSTDKVEETSCCTMPQIPLNPNFTKVPCSLDSIDAPYVEIFNGLYNTNDLSKILYYPEKNELWIIVHNKTAEMSATIKKMVRQTSQDAMDLIVFVLDCTQLDVSEVPSGFFGVSKEHEV